jgi:hypothetical protein
MSFQRSIKNVAIATSCEPQSDKAVGKEGS